MELNKGSMLDGRYKLISPLGSGATAQVWMALDSLANIRVAVKVFDALEGDGVSDFQKEFSTVYNINHQNLLTPTNYSVSGDVPYLVMPFCENGSAQTMVGRCDQADIVPFIRDVAAALACLHANNIVHQDIKPENILIDDNLHFKVTDFGISSARDGDNLTYGGTYPYMAAERFNGQLAPSGDIWGLGATIFEMLEGTTPFGNDGGIAQAQGSPVPPITKTKVDSFLYDLICKMLDPDPALRPTADQIQQEMEYFLRYKRWKGHNPMRQYAFAAFILAVFAASLFIWSQTRTKVYYCQDFVEVNGEPQMIGRLYGSEHRARYFSYRVEVKGGHVQRISLVNPADSRISLRDYSQIPLRYPDQEYTYKNGQVEKVVCRDENGCQVLAYVYDIQNDVTNIIFKDEKGDAQFYSSAYYSSNGIEDLYGGRSNIQRMVLKFDDKGRVIERTYKDSNSRPITDANGAFSHRLSYDDNGRVTSVAHFDDNDHLVADATGCAQRCFEYDATGNLIKVAMLDADNKPACDYQGRAVVNLEYDNGNMVHEWYTNAYGRPVARRVDGVYGFRVTYENGYCTEYTGLDANGMPMLNNEGFAIARFELDPASGQDASQRFFDVKNNFVYGYQIEYDNLGREIKRFCIDQNANHITGREGFCLCTTEYDDNGHTTKIAFFDTDNNPAEVAGTHCIQNEYDQSGRLVSITSYNKNNSIAPDLDGVCITSYQYRDFSDLPQKVSYLDANNRLVNSKDGYAIEENEYDEAGRLICVRYKDADSRPVSFFDISSIKLNYVGARLANVQGLNGSDVKLTVSASLLADGLPLLRAPGFDTPVAFYEDNNGQTRSIVAKDSLGNNINVIMPNGAIAHRLTMSGENVSCTSTSGEQAPESRERLQKMAAAYFIINSYFYDYALLYPNYVIKEETPQQTEQENGSTTSTSAQTAWQRTLQEQNRHMPTVLESDEDYTWLLMRYEWTNNSITVVLKAKHISGSVYEADDVNSYIRRFKTYPNRQFGISQSIPVKVKVLNNQNRTIIQR